MVRNPQWIVRIRVFKNLIKGHIHTSLDALRELAERLRQSNSLHQWSYELVPFVCEAHEFYALSPCCRNPSDPDPWPIHPHPEGKTSTQVLDPNELLFSGQEQILRPWRGQATRGYPSVNFVLTVSSLVAQWSSWATVICQSRHCGCHACRCGAMWGLRNCALVHVPGDQCS